MKHIVILALLVGACTCTADIDAHLGSDPSALTGTFRTSNLLVDDSISLGAQVIDPQQAMLISKVNVDTNAQLWIQSNGTAHVGTGGNNELIGIVISNQTAFNTTGGQGNAKGIEIAVDCSVSSGGNPCVDTAVQANAADGYAWYSEAGAMRHNGTATFGPGVVDLGTNVANFELPGSTSAVARIGIGALPSVNGTGIQIKNTVAASALSGAQVGLDTTVNAGIRGGYLISRGAGGDFGGNTSGIAIAGGSGFPFSASAANELSVYSETGQSIVFGADSSGFTSTLRMTPKNHLVVDTGTPTRSVSCNSGTGVSLVGTDIAFKLLTGTTSTACTITFAQTYTSAPICIITAEGGAVLPTYTISAPAITMTVNLGATTYNAHCYGQPGST